MIHYVITFGNQSRNHVDARQVKPKKMVATTITMNASLLARVALKAMGSPTLSPKLARKGPEYDKQHCT